MSVQNQQSDSVADPASELPEKIANLPDGKALRVDGHDAHVVERGYYLVVNDTLLQITDDLVVSPEPELVGYYLSVALETTETDAGEAWAYFHNEIVPDVKRTCMACGATSKKKICDCPIGLEISDVSWPQIEPRHPRMVRDGRAIQVP